MTTSTDPPEELVAISRFRSPLAAVAGGLLAGLAALTIYSTRDDWRYYLHAQRALDLGPAEKALANRKLRHNTYVKLDGRPLLASEGHAEIADTRPGCLTGPTRKIHFTLLAETGDRILVRTRRSLKDQQIARRTTFTGRLLRIDTDEEAHRLYRRFVHRLTDCKNHPKTCDKFLLVSADIATETLLANLGKRKAVLRGVKGESIEVTPATPLYLAFRYPGEYEYTVRGVKKEEAIAHVQRLGLPFCWVGSTADDQDFVLRMPTERAQALIRSQRRGSGYSISERTAGYHVRFGSLVRDGAHLKITRATPGFPEQYRVGPADQPGGPPSLVPMSQEGRGIRVPIAQVSKAAYHGPRRIPRRAWLVVDGVQPRHALTAGLIALGMVLLALAALALVILGLRRPR